MFFLFLDLGDFVGQSGRVSAAQVVRVANLFRLECIFYLQLQRLQSNLGLARVSRQLIELEMSYDSL